MVDFKELLLSVGLTEEEVTIYFATLQPQNATILKISQYTGIPRTTVYVLIEELLAKGFIYEVAEGKKKQYIPAAPEKIISYVQAKRQQFTDTLSQLQKNIPEIQALYNYYHEKPRISYYEGNKDILSQLEKMLGEGEVCLHIMSESGNELFSNEFDLFRKQIQEKMIATREIVSDSLTNKHYMKTYANVRNKVRYIPLAYGTNVDYVLFSNGYLQITYKNDKAMAVCIEDKHMAQFEKVRFNLLWEHPLLKEDNK